MVRKHPVESVAPPLTTNPFARIAGRAAPLHQLLVQAARALAARGISVRMPSVDPLEDYVQIDPSLARIPVHELSAAYFQGTPGPADGLGYVGFDAEARSRFLLWLDHPEHMAPASFQTLYLAHVESALLEAIAAGEMQAIERVIAALRALEAWPHWLVHEQRARTLLFAYLLLGDGAQIGAWLAEGRPTLQVIGVALGWQALLGAPLTATEMLGVARLWDIADEGLDLGVAALRLRSLTENMGVDPLTHALHAAMPPDAPAPASQLWRSAHRDLRVEFVQLDLKLWLAPLLAEALDDVPLAAATRASASDAETEVEADADRNGWTLILEFSHSRSEYFEFALKQAQRMAGYGALVDEQRRVVYRVLIRKSEMRRFWQLWDYVMSWSETRVYLNGKELEKWKIYPYSQYLSG